MSRSSAAMPRVRPKRAAKKEPHSSDGDSTAQGHPLILAMLDNMGEGVAARLLYDTKAGILLNEHVAENGAAVSEHACRLGAEGIVSKKVDGTLSVRSVSGLDQGPQSREHRGAAGAPRELE